MIVAPMFDGSGQGPTARSVMSGSSGEFSFPALEPGTYTVTGVKNADPLGFDAALALAKRPMFFADLRAAPTSIARWIDTPLVAWSVGFMFGGEENARIRVVPKRAYDAVIYVDHVRAAHGL